MVSYRSRIETIIERLQSRRKTIEISKREGGNDDRQQPEAIEREHSVATVEQSKKVASRDQLEVANKVDYRQSASPNSLEAKQCINIIANHLNTPEKSPIISGVSFEKQLASSQSLMSSPKSMVAVSSFYKLLKEMIPKSGAGALKPPNSIHPILEHKMKPNESGCNQSISCLTKRQFRQSSQVHALATCPGLLYAAILILFTISLTLHQVAQVQASTSNTTSNSNNNNNNNNDKINHNTDSNNNLIERTSGESQIQAGQDLGDRHLITGQLRNVARQALGDFAPNLARQLMALGSNNRNRWLDVPNPPSRPSSSIGANDNRRRNWWRRQNLISRTLDRIGNGIGARNTIRVHNAFRDLAWRLLSSFSMPTPVIYELRRQNFYSPDEDNENDLLHNRNTSKTIRSKRLLKFWPTGSNKVPTNSRAGDDDDDDDEPESFRDRFRMRVEDLANLSRRSLFGRVIRIPSLFPFKRQHDDGPDNSSAKDDKPTLKGKLLPRRRRSKKKDTDRQLITINGIQYYVDDDGGLKQLKNDE